MLKKLVLLSGLLLTSLSAQATLISHFGYERDSASNTVTGGGLEWLKWDETKNMSINTALTAHAAHGWRLASNIEIASLFNAFQFGTYVFTDNETAYQGMHGVWTMDENSRHSAFINLFGRTDYSACDSAPGQNCNHPDDPKVHAVALYGSDGNGNKLFNLADVYDDYLYYDLRGQLRQVGPGARAFEDGYTTGWAGDGVGIALVRVSSWTPPVSVPTPGSIGLLALGLVALGYRRRQVLGR